MSQFNYLQKYVANKVRFHRKAQGLSQETLSERAGLGLKYINHIENKNHNLRLETLEKVITALGMTPEEFFNFNSLEGNPDTDRQLTLKRLNMKIKQLPKKRQETFIAIFEEIIDNLH
ncbi:TPA: helix-turn-helix domain-containing protein [Streptococcus suis]|nr:helix-turn-helix transcriptional regulator [Streptococcus suis]